MHPGPHAASRPQVGHPWTLQAVTAWLVSVPSHFRCVYAFELEVDETKSPVLLHVSKGYVSKMDVYC